MTILQKVLSSVETNTLELLLNGAFAPLSGYLGQADVVSVLNKQRLSNGRLWPLPFILALTPSEKLTAQLNDRIILLDSDKRALAQVTVSDLYRLPAAEVALAAKFDVRINNNTWFAAGEVVAIKKILHPAFNSLRHDVPTLKHNLREWKSVIAVQAAPIVDVADLKRACEWLSGTGVGGGLLVQVNADEHQADFHAHIRALRTQVKCTAARQIKLSILPCVQGLDAQRCALLQALVSRNFGATSFVISKDVPLAAQRWLLQHRDEIGLEIIPAQRSRIKTALAHAA